METVNEKKQKKTSRGGSQTMFPGRLHELLEYVESQGLDYIVSWVRDGTAFMVHNQAELLKLLSFFFGQTKFRSFTRQLNMWCFQREEIGPFKGSFSHPCFVKHDKSLCAKMSRHEPKSRGMRPSQPKKTNEINGMLFDSYIQRMEGNMSWSASTASTQGSENACPVTPPEPDYGHCNEQESLFTDPRSFPFLQEDVMSSCMMDDNMTRLNHPQNTHYLCHPTGYFHENILQEEINWTPNQVPLPSADQGNNLDGSLFFLDAADALEPTPIVERAVSQKHDNCWSREVDVTTVKVFRSYLPTIPQQTRQANFLQCGSIVEALGGDEEALYLLRLLQAEK